MIRISILSLVALFTGAPAIAQTLPVRSGEHDGFSRLVLPLPPDAKWTVEQSGRQASIRVSLPNVVFDAAAVFDRIPRTRLLDAAQARPGATLDLTLGCDCKVTGFAEGRSHLVIDIADGLPAVPDQMPFLPLPARTPLRFGYSAPPLASGSLARAPAQSASEPLAPFLPPHAEVINVSERRLMEQIGRAAGQGMVDLIRPDISQPPIHATPETGEPGQSTRAETAPDVRKLPVSLTAVTAADRDLDALAQMLPTNATAADCPDPDHFDLPAWGSDASFTAQTAPLLPRLYSEFDRLDPQIALTLARVYLFFGLGAEARRVAELLPDGHAYRRDLLVVADIVDDGELETPAPIADARACTGDVAVWAALATQLVPGADHEPVLRAFSRLPAHLRAHLGPILAGRFTDADDAGAAEAVLRAAARTGDADPDAIDLAEAAISGLRHDPEAEIDKLQSVSDGGSAHAPYALVQLVDRQWQTGPDIAQDLPDLVGAHALEYRGTEVGPEIRHAHVVALAMAGRFGEARRALDDLMVRDGLEAGAEAGLPFLAAVTARADDLEFLRTILEDETARVEHLPADLGNAVARRLLDLGLASVAAEFVLDRDEGAAEPDRRRLRAEVSLGLGHPHRALVHLMGLDDPEAVQLRAAALAQTGNLRAAGETLLASDVPVAATRHLWLAGVPIQGNAEPGGDGDGDTQTGSKYLEAAVLSGRIAEDPPAGSALPPLAQARALLESSARSRGEIETLSRMFDVPKRATDAGG